MDFDMLDTLGATQKIVIVWKEYFKIRNWDKYYVAQRV